MTFAHGLFIGGVLGLFIGAALGVFLMCLMFAAADRGRY